MLGREPWIVSSTFELDNKDVVGRKLVKEEEVSKTRHEQEEFVCHYCDARFKIRGYLTRHIKKHALQKAYYCPYYNEKAPPDLRCHNNGGFSRRDTYKAHMKTRHIMYPSGVKSQERFKSSGHCSHCGEYSPNVEFWVEDHVESGQCTALPEEYILKQSKNGKTERKVNRVKMIKTSNGQSRFISTTRSIMDSKVLLNEDAMEALTIVAEHVKRSDILTKYGTNKILLDSADFDKDVLESKPKNRYTEEPLEDEEEEEEEMGGHPFFGRQKIPSFKPLDTENTNKQDQCIKKNSADQHVPPLDSEQSSMNLDYLLEFEAGTQSVKNPLPRFNKDVISKQSQRSLEEYTTLYTEYFKDTFN